MVHVGGIRNTDFDLVRGAFAEVYGEFHSQCLFSDEFGKNGCVLGEPRLRRLSVKEASNFLMSQDIA
jgi:hypothetical protein